MEASETRRTTTPSDMKNRHTYHQRAKRAGAQRCLALIARAEPQRQNAHWALEEALKSIKVIRGAPAVSSAGQCAGRSSLSQKRLCFQSSAVATSPR